MASPTETTGSETSVNSDREGPDGGRGATIRIEAPRGAWASLRLRELWEYRELLYFFVWRDVKVRYKQTIFGGLWAVIRPLFTMVIFSIFFGRLAGVPSDGLPYPVFSFAALVPWQFFEQGVVQSADSLVANARLVTKVYFPRLTIPIAAVLSGLVDFGVAFAILLVIMAFYGIAPPDPGPDVAAVLASRVRNRARRWSLARRSQCQVPRCPIHGSVPDASVVVPDARRLSIELARRTLAHDLRPEPDGRRRRRLPLGPPWFRLFAAMRSAIAIGPGFIPRRGRPAHRRSVLFPPIGESLRGHRMNDPGVP